MVEDASPASTSLHLHTELALGSSRQDSVDSGSPGVNRGGTDLTIIMLFAPGGTRVNPCPRENNLGARGGTPCDAVTSSRASPPQGRVAPQEPKRHGEALSRVAPGIDWSGPR